MADTARAMSDHEEMLQSWCFYETPDGFAENVPYAACRVRQV
jgi:hypothetical protein